MYGQQQQQPGPQQAGWNAQPYPPQHPQQYPQQGGYPQQSGGYPPPQGYVPPSGGYPPYNPQYPNSSTNNMPTEQFNYADPESTNNNQFNFNDQIIRKAFIRKVYSILMVQLSITFGVICLFIYHKPTQEWTNKHPELFWIAIVVMLVTLISMACCTNVRRKAPLNFIFLFLFTIAESFLLGVVSAVYESEEVMMAVGLTAAVCLALTIFAFQTKWDFTTMGGVLFAAAIILLIFGIVAIFVQGKTFTILYASLGAILFSFYLIYDTQLMMGGKHKYSISPEEYIFAALNLYLDIVNIFLYILTIIGAAKK